MSSIVRCPWTGIADAEYARYHDEEWGVPHADDRRLFEKLILEGFQAGLSWLTILKKRETFRQAFDAFDASKIIQYDEAKIAELMQDTGIIRNRAKIEATIDNARALIELQKQQSLSSFLWAFVDFKPIQNQLSSLSGAPAETPISKAISKSLKARGFRFVGPTTVYAFMQASGFVNDHLVSCPRYAPCAKLHKSFRHPEAPGR